MNRAESATLVSLNKRMLALLGLCKSWVIDSLAIEQLVAHGACAKARLLFMSRPPRTSAAAGNHLSIKLILIPQDRGCDQKRLLLSIHTFTLPYTLQTQVERSRAPGGVVDS